MKMSIGTRCIAGLVLVLSLSFAAFALFANLDDRLLWGDEAETALLAANINIYGLPKAADGNNYITLLGAGRDTNRDDIWVWSPWLDEYLAALSFALWGRSTATARLPFAAIAFLSVLLLAGVVWRIYGDIRLTAIGALLFATNVAFLLHARQCRYYALVCIAQLLIVYGYHGILTGRNRLGTLIMTAGMVVQFHSNYMVVIPNLLALLISYLIAPRWRALLRRPLWICFAGFAAGAIPWVAYAQPWHQASQIAMSGYGGKLLEYARRINAHIVPVVILILPLLAWCLPARAPGRLKTPDAVRQTHQLLWLQAGAGVCVLSLAPGVFFRYLLPLIPVLIILATGIIANLIRSSVLRVAVLALLISTNALSLPFDGPSRPFRGLDMPLIRYVKSITSTYENQTEDVVRFLRAGANASQSVYVYDPEFPLIFYTGMKVIDARLFPHIERDRLPDWILPENASGVEAPVIALPPELTRRYEAIVLYVHDTPRGDSRPDPAYHVFFSADRRREFIIYRKKAEAPR